MTGCLASWATMTRLTAWLTDKDPTKSECRFTFSARWLHARHGHARYGSADGAHGAHGWHGPHGTHGHAAQLSKLCHGWLRSWKPQFWYGQRLIQNQVGWSGWVVDSKSINISTKKWLKSITIGGFWRYFLWVFSVKTATLAWSVFSLYGVWSCKFVSYSNRCLEANQ